MTCALPFPSPTPSPATVCASDASDLLSTFPGLPPPPTTHTCSKAPPTSAAPGTRSSTRRPAWAHATKSPSTRPPETNSIVSSNSRVIDKIFFCNHGREDVADFVLTSRTSNNDSLPTQSIVAECAQRPGVRRHVPPQLPSDGGCSGALVFVILTAFVLLCVLCFLWQFISAAAPQPSTNCRFSGVWVLVLGISFGNSVLWCFGISPLPHPRSLLACQLLPNWQCDLASCISQYRCSLRPRSPAAPASRFFPFSSFSVDRR